MLQHKLAPINIVLWCAKSHNIELPGMIRKAYFDYRGIYANHEAPHVYFFEIYPDRITEEFYQTIAFIQSMFGMLGNNIYIYERFMDNIQYLRNSYPNASFHINELRNFFNKHN